MIVYDFNIVCVSLAPTEADTPPVIDPNAALSFPVSSKFLKAIFRRDEKVIQLLRRIQQEQFTLNDALQNGREFLRGLAVKYLFSLFGCKSPDHDCRW
jgi:hypothetical protein